MKRLCSGSIALVLLATPALAHTGARAAEGFAAGLAHPLLGLDHVLAMVAVGLLAGFRGGPALLVWPAAFVAAMLLGGALGVSAVAVPGVEAMILLSTLVLGGLLARGLRVTPALGAALVGAFALFHGHAHGAEIAAGASGLAYAAGFTATTALLHGLGIVLARSRRSRAAELGIGSAITAAGLLMAVLG